MALTITVEISDHNEKVLLHNIRDIDDWVQAAVVGKINNCSKRMANEATTVLKADNSVETMPATDEGIQKALLARDDYKNRAARDKAAKL
jgi:hypothetical protein